MDLIQAKSEAKRRNNILSEELEIEILARLPVISLLRFKCVCKSWRSLIRSPFFIQKHLQVCNSINNPNLLFKTKICDRVNWYSMQYDTMFIVSLQTLQVIETLNDPPRIRDNWWPQILGSCNGLICLYCNVNYGNGAIWNPAIRETKVLPCSLIQESLIRAAGFGFDANNNDYKVFLIHLFIDGVDDYDDDDEELSKPKDFQLEYYSLRTNSWKLVNEIQGMDLLFEDGTIGAYTNGMISWLAYNEEVDYSDPEIWPFTCRDEIISFDISNEVIIRTPLPNNIGSHELGQSVNHVRVLNESFAVVSDNFHECEFDIWVLREVGVVESWTKLFTVGPLPHSVSAPLVIWKEGVVFWNRKDKELILYDSANLQKSCVGIPKTQYRLKDAVVYRESLVPLFTDGTT